LALTIRACGTLFYHFFIFFIEKGEKKTMKKKKKQQNNVKRQLNRAEIFFYPIVFRFIISTFFSTVEKLLKNPYPADSDIQYHLQRFPAYSAIQHTALSLLQRYPAYSDI